MTQGVTAYDRQNMVNKRLFYASLGVALCGAAFWTFFEFLAAEDALVLFNRYNFLHEAPAFFYYAGYWSLFPQLSAFLMSDLSFVAQAISYSIFGWAVFSILLHEMFKATQSGLIVFAMAVVSTSFAPFMVFNLTYTLWPGLAILGLVGLRFCQLGQRPSFWDILKCIPGLAGSPLAVLYLPLFAWASYRNRSAGLLFLCAMTFISFIVLPERNGARSDIGEMSASAIGKIKLVVSDPWGSTINFSGLNDLVMSGLGVFSTLLGVSLTLFFLATLPRHRDLAVPLYVAGSLMVLVAAVGSVPVPLAGRYWFPTIVCGAVLLGRYWPAGWSMVWPRFLVVGFVVCASTLVFMLFIARTASWGGLSYAWHQWETMHNPPMGLSAIARDWHDTNIWAIGVGSGQVAYTDCAGQPQHPTVFEAYGFRIYCGSPVFK